MTSPSPSTSHRRTWLQVGGALVLVAATAGVTVLVTHHHPAPKPAAAVATESPAAVETPSEAPPSPTPPPVHRFGNQVPANDGSALVTVYGFKQPVATDATRPDQAGFEWAAADVQVCAQRDGTLSNRPWRLVYSDNTQITASEIGYQQFPKPEYPWGDQNVSGGQCVRGWITFPAPKSSRPVSVVYSPEDSTIFIAWLLN